MILYESKDIVATLLEAEMLGLRPGDITQIHYGMHAGCLVLSNHDGGKAYLRSETRNGDIQYILVNELEGEEHLSDDHLREDSFNKRISDIVNIIEELKATGFLIGEIEQIPNTNTAAAIVLYGTRADQPRKTGLFSAGNNYCIGLVF